MAATSKIISFVKSIGGKIDFTFADGTTASGIYDTLTGAKISGTGNAPSIFSVTNIAKAVKFTTTNIKNLEKLLPTNFVLNNKLVADYKSKVLKAVSANIPDVVINIKNKIKDILGIFNLPFTKLLDLPKIAGLPVPNISDLLGKATTQLKAIRETTTNLVKSSILNVKNSIKKTVNLGDLNVAKLAGVADISVTSPLQKKELSQSLVKQKQLEEKAIADSTLSMEEKAIKKAEILVQQVQTGQNIVSAITQVN